MRLSALELLNFVYSSLMSDTDHEGRLRINAALEGRIGEGGGIVIDDPSMPAALQGQEAPSWWRDDEDPFANQHTINAS